jgi:hypothetical protein
MGRAALDRAAGRHQRLSDHLPAEHPLPADLRAAAAVEIGFKLFEIENGQQLINGFGHHIPGS